MNEKSGEERTLFEQVEFRFESQDILGRSDAPGFAVTKDAGDVLASP